MPQDKTINRRIILDSRPDGAPVAQNFRLEEDSVPAPASGELLLRTLWLSLDPYMRGRMSEGPVAVGGVIEGGTVSRVEASKHAGFAVGDLVLGYAGWQDFAVSDGKGLTKLDAAMKQPSWALGVLGMPGFTAYMGLLDIGQPQEGDTVVGAAARGARGAGGGPISKLRGCRSVGIAGGPEKCRYVVEELGFDACIDHRGGDLPQRLAAACPKGIDVYFESVGGAVFDAVMPLLNAKARIPLCGLIANYNDKGVPTGPDRLGLFARAILTKRLKVQGFIIFNDYGHRLGEFTGQMESWLWENKIKVREDIVDGLENAPEAFIGLLAGRNFGKLIIRVAED
jgi:NADPH-dependent curcumin reductase CurA